MFDLMMLPVIMRTFTDSPELPRSVLWNGSEDNNGKNECSFEKWQKPTSVHGQPVNASHTVDARLEDRRPCISTGCPFELGNGLAQLRDPDTEKLNDSSPPAGVAHFPTDPGETDSTRLPIDESLTLDDIQNETSGNHHSSCKFYV